MLRSTTNLNLIRPGANVTISNCFGGTPIHRIANTQRADIAMMLLENGADMHAKDTYESTPFSSCSTAMRRFFQAYERARSFWLKQGCSRAHNNLNLTCLRRIQSFDEGAAQLR